MRLAEDIRAGTWWSHKLAPILATGYATAYFAREDLVDAAASLVLALFALAAGSAYVSVLNDLTDRASDAAAGKPNRSVGRSTRHSAALIGGSVVAGWLPVLLAWADRPWVLAAYAAPWIAFTAYSLPPVRLKARGAAGALADAAGAEVFPHLFMMAVVFASAGPGGPGGRSEWIVAVLTWALGRGIRGAIMHQLLDADLDRRSSLSTFGARHPVVARRVGRLVALPVEVAGFGAMLVISGLPFALPVAAVLAGLTLAGARRRGEAMVIVDPPRGPHRVAMQALSVVVFPLAYLAAASVRSPVDLAVLAAHVVVFHRPIRDELYVLRRDLSPALVRGADPEARARD